MSDAPGAWDHDRYCDLVGEEVARAVAVVRDVDPDAPVPTCPEWKVRDLVEHLGRVHRWAGKMVRDTSQERLDRSQYDSGGPPDDDLAGWLASGGAGLVDALRACDPDARMWSWGADRHARFWARRQLHETAVHRADAEFAAGRQPSIEADIAADGIDEFLDNLPHAVYFAAGVKELRGDGETLAFAAEDTGAAWLIQLTPEGFRWQRRDGDRPEGAATMRAPASDLLLLVYGRRKVADPNVTVDGDAKLVDHWLEHSSI